MFDVLGGVIFTNSRGELADAREIVPDVKLLPDRPLRVELQMPWPRVVYETQQAMGMPWRNGRP